MESLEQRQNRALALAGVVQAAFMVKQLATKGTLNTQEFETCVHSILQITAPSVSEVYGKTKNLTSGAQQLIALLGGGKLPKDPDVARYTISLLHLERTLSKKPEMINIIQRGVERAKNQSLHFGVTHENVIANLSGIYSDTLSKLSFRIHVKGDGSYLSNPNTVNKIRTILLAGVRSAVLWRQLEGSRWQFMFGKRALLNDVQKLVKDLQSQPAWG